jgi:hypothetical protein
MLCFLENSSSMNIGSFRPAKQVKLTISASVMVRRYADGSSRKTTQLLQMLEQSGQQMKAGDMPRLEASLTALATAAAGR